MNTEEETPPPVCLICQEQTLTVKHIFTECRRLAHIREEILGKEYPTLREALGDGKIGIPLFTFMNRIRMTNLV